ncbi:uncharacterized protein PpBr36_09408 [Pyricularia pennisetigena]|uniref:uncharacterized protein n=1 Tax=Pyricularia pennisetigena TaxID=1578925 RepID=UPI001152DCF7|nr:uncharacterized protein PpBr36_09408 [Pyricularia pennisetigena]TLS21961.1 hypothetical protein PpBr36_09408 [Pyricularia pennisetigena]
MDPQAPALANSTKPQLPRLLETLAENKGLLLLQSRMVLTAIAIIYVGAHATIRRPPSAAPRTSNKFAKDKDGKNKKKKKEEAQFVEGFQASDAILFPILAGLTLVGLYYLIQWMDDPEFISKIISGYFSIASLFSLGKLLGDVMHFTMSFVFPNVWKDGEGKLWRFDPVRRRQLVRTKEIAEEQRDASAEGNSVTSADHTSVDQRGFYRDESGSWHPDEKHLMPFPGPLSTLSCADSTRNKLWAVRLLAKEHWTVKLGLHGFGKTEFQLTLCDVLGLVAAAAVAAAYQYTGATVLSNIMGLGMCYGAFQLMSPTSFAIGTMVLAGLFVYDIVMVFYTPYMITVATKVDAPIKLTFGEPKKGSMLGLGDIVLPGIFMCLCLRFDLWRHYQSKITETKQNLSSELAGQQIARSPQRNEDGAENKTITQDEPKMVVGEIGTIQTKAEYIDPQGRWGDLLWTTGLKKANSTVGLASTQFAKTYFMAAVWGYAFGMVLTISMLLTFNHGQPALLYLVPCVTGAAWLTGFVRGEVADMWRYTEDGSLDVKDVVVTVDADGKVVEEDQTKGEATNKAASGEAGEKLADQKSVNADHESVVKSSSQDEAEARRREGHDVFMFILRAPGIEEMDEFDV